MIGPSHRRGLGFALCALAGLMLGCEDSGVQPPPDEGPPPSITQGIRGEVWFWSGDFMPIRPSGSVTGVERDVWVHELTKLSQVDPGPSPGFFRAVHTPLVAETRSDTSGAYEVSLAPGRYSLFVRENDLYYANDFDGEGNIQPVEVVTDSVTPHRIDITYEATY